MNKGAVHPVVEALNARNCGVAGANLGVLLSAVLAAVMLLVFGALLAWNALVMWPPLRDDLALRDSGVAASGRAEAVCSGPGAFSHCRLEIAYQGPDGTPRTKVLDMMGFSLDASRSPLDLRVDPRSPDRASTGLGRMELANRVAWQALVVLVMLLLLAACAGWFGFMFRHARAGLRLGRESRFVEARVLDAAPRASFTALTLAWRDPTTGEPRQGRALALVDPSPLFLDRAGRTVLAFANAHGDVATADRWLRDTDLDEAERERMRLLAEPRLLGT